MDICIIGAGYVGLATAAGCCELGHRVTCADNDGEKIACLRAGQCPIHEPGLPEMLSRNLGDGRLTFTTDTQAAVRASEIVFIAVGTPADGDGDADLTHLRAAARDVAAALDGCKLVVLKSTVPVGAGDLVARIISEHAPPGADFDFCANPEFLREGCALADTRAPARIVIGAADHRAAEKLAELYFPLQRPLVLTDIATAEMIKYASNAFLATKISFVNAIADICELTGADVSTVAQGMGMDPRIGREFLKPGLGYGGSCLSKDTECLIATAAGLGYDFGLLREVQAINDSRVSRLAERMEAMLDGLNGKTIGVLGLAFKPGTDDLRGSKAVELIQALLERGAAVRAYDPVAMRTCCARFPRVDYAENPYDLARGCHALVVATEWDEFQTLDLATIRDLMVEPVIFDGRNLYDPQALRALGFRYYGVGRP